MEPQGSLPHSQVPATCPYPKPARSGPYPHIALPEDPTSTLNIVHTRYTITIRIKKLYFIAALRRSAQSYLNENLSI
jgi:hypothetical protein